MAAAMERDSASLDRMTLRQEKGHLEEHLEAMSQNLKSTQEKLNLSEVKLLF